MDNVRSAIRKKLKNICETSANLTSGMVMVTLARQALRLYYTNSDNATLTYMSLGAVVTLVTVIEVLLHKFGMRSSEHVLKTVVKLSLVLVILLLIAGVLTMVMGFECEDFVRESALRQFTRRTGVPLIDHAAIWRSKEECETGVWDCLTICGLSTVVLRLIVDLCRPLTKSASSKIEGATSTRVSFGQVDAADR